MPNKFNFREVKANSIRFQIILKAFSMFKSKIFFKLLKRTENLPSFYLTKGSDLGLTKQDY
jgi:hypothetical protein